MSDKLMLFEFSAPWCSPCKAIKPIIEKVLTNFDNITLVDINVDESPELAREYDVRAIPTLILKRGDKVLQRLTGSASFEQLSKFFSANS